MTIEEAQEEIKDLKVKVNEFRDNNIKLKEQIEAFDGIDADKVKELLATQKDVETKELIKAGDVEAALEKQKEALTADFDKRLSAVQEESAGLRGDLHTLQVTDKLKDAALEAGAREDAVPDLVKSAASDWQLKDGQPVYIVNDQIQLSKTDAGENMGMEEYFKGLATSKPFFFNGSGGAGGEEDKGKRKGAPRVIPRSEMGKYTKEIKAGEVVVEGYEPVAA
jgi:predicted RNase H-like nuclease (RuvC/YqgF family)